MPRSKNHLFVARQRSTINKQVTPVASTRGAASSASTPAPAPAVAYPTPVFAPPQHQPSSFGQSMKDGFGIGVGSAIAHRAVSAVFGAPKVETIGSEKKETTATILQPTSYEQCMKYNSNDHETCKAYLTGSQSSSQ